MAYILGIGVAAVMAVTLGTVAAGVWSYRSRRP